MTDINIKETIIDKTTDFNIKRFRIGTHKFEIPVKTIDISYITQSLIESNFRDNQQIVIEKSKVLNNFQSIKDILDSPDETSINSFFGKKNWAQNYFSNITLSLKFNPFNYLKKLDEIEGFFDYYHSYSKDTLLVPNICHIVSKDKIITVDQYLLFVDSIYHILNSRNGKPIFVPISLSFSIKDIEIIIDYYLKKEYFYIWFDLESKPINQAIGGRLRRINNLLRESGQYDKIITHYTNIKREILSNVKDIQNSESSDILASTMGANIIGVNRNLKRFNPNFIGKQPSPKEVWIHKARKFNAKTYYYEKQDIESVKPRNENITINSKLLNSELNVQSKMFLEQNELGTYLKTKDMLKNNSVILNNLLRIKSNQRRWTDFV